MDFGFDFFAGEIDVTVGGYSSSGRAVSLLGVHTVKHRALGGRPTCSTAVVRLRVKFLVRFQSSIAHDIILACVESYPYTRQGMLSWLQDRKLKRPTTKQEQRQTTTPTTPTTTSTGENILCDSLALFCSKSALIIVEPAVIKKHNPHSRAPSSAEKQVLSGGKSGMGACLHEVETLAFLKVKREEAGLTRERSRFAELASWFYRRSVVGGVDHVCLVFRGGGLSLWEAMSARSPPPLSTAGSVMPGGTVSSPPSLAWGVGEVVEVARGLLEVRIHEWRGHASPTSYRLFLTITEGTIWLVASLLHVL